MKEDRTFQKKCIASQAELDSAMGRFGAAVACRKACPAQGWGLGGEYPARLPRADRRFVTGIDAQDNPNKSPSSGPRGEWEFGCFWAQEFGDPALGCHREFRKLVASPLLSVPISTP